MKVQKMKKNIHQLREQKPSNEISRREAMGKMGLVAFSAATMLLLLNKPEKLKAQDSSGSPDNPDTW